MFPQRLDVDLAFEAFSVSASIPLAPAERAYRRLAERNAVSRARDEDPSLRPCLKIRVVCPDCSAPIYYLTAYARDGEWLRGCRRCRHEFPVEV